MHTILVHRDSINIDICSLQLFATPQSPDVRIFEGCHWHLDSHACFIHSAVKQATETCQIPQAAQSTRAKNDLHLHPGIHACHGGKRPLFARSHRRSETNINGNEIGDIYDTTSNACSQNEGHARHLLFTVQSPNFNSAEWTPRIIICQIRSGCFSVPQKIHIQTNFFPLSTIDSSNLPIADQIRNEIDVFGFHPDTMPTGSYNLWTSVHSGFPGSARSQKSLNDVISLIHVV